jgi:PAS domain S-box-containing protein
MSPQAHRLLRWLHRSRRSGPKAWLHPLAVAAVVLLLSAAIRLALPQVLADGISYPLYLLAAIAAAWFGGAAAVLLVVALGLPLLLSPPLAADRDWAEFAAIGLLAATSLAVGTLAVLLRRAVEQIRADRARYQTVLNSVGDALLVVDADGRLEFFNRKAKAVFDLGLDALGRPLHELLPLWREDGSRYDPFAEIRDRRAQQHLPDGLEAGLGVRRPLAGSIAPVAAGNGDGDSGHVLSLQDVSALRDSHEQLSRSEAKLRQIFDSELLAIFSVDLDGRLRSSNAAFLGLLGYSPAEPGAVPQSLQEMTPAEFRELDATALEELISRGACRPYSKALFRRDGSRVWVTVGGAIVDGNEAAFFAIDARARNEAEERVAESRQLLQSIIDSVPAFVAYVDAGGRYRLGNRHPFGAMAPAAVRDGRAVAEVFERGQYVRLAPVLRRALAGEPARTLLAVDDPGGEVRHYQVQLQPRRDERGDAVAGVVLHAFEITDQLQRQRALLDSEVRFRRLAEASAAIVCHLDISGRIIHLSGWRRFVGDGGPTERLACLFDHVHPADMPVVRRFVARLRRHRTTAEAEFRLRHRSHGYRQLAVRAVPLRGRLGDEVQWVCSARDVHERRLVLEQLRRAEQEQRLILDTMPARIAYIEADGRFRWANRAFLDSVGFSGEIRGARTDQVYTPLARVALGDTIARALRGQHGQVEWMDEDIGHGPRWWITTVTPDLGPDQQVAGCITLCIDHTERKRTEQALRRSNREHRALAESVPHMVWIAYGDGRMFYFNQRWRDYTGLSSVDAWHQAIDAEDRAGALVEFRSAVASGQELATEVRLLRADGAARWHVMRAVPVAGDGLDVARWYGTCTDIEDQKQAQNILQRAQERTQQFLATLSHELRNPLSALMTSAHLLNRDDLPEAQRPLLSQTVRRQTVQLQRLVEDLLDVSRITQGKIQLQLEDVDLAEIVRDVSADFAERAGSQGVALDCVVPPGAAWVRGDPARLRQIVDNLISNALKATSEGGRVELSLEEEGGRRRLRVVDTGPGIPEALFAKMFEPFVQGENWRERGLGLGLSVVARMTDLHGGEVRAANRRRVRGACFDVLLPIASAPTPPPAAPPPTRIAETTAADVLIIDDEVDHAEALRLLLELQGFRIRVAHEGEQALSELASQRPDAVICDIGLPGVWNGYRLAERMRIDHGNDLLLVAFSGYGSPADVQRSMAAGFDHHLVKPSSPSQVMRALSDGLARKRNVSA